MLEQISMHILCYEETTHNKHTSISA